MRITLTAILPVLVFIAFRAIATDPPGPPAPGPKPTADPQPEATRLDRQFRETVLPYLQTYCTGCHGKEKPKADVNLAAFTSVESVAKDHRQWAAIRDQLKDGTMPPETAKKRPAPAESKAVVEWIDALIRFESARRAGDPGPVPPRRLSNAEYDYTVRDLTGVDIRPTREFPVDPANEAGFDNSAESLTMSPALLKKYLEAARLVSDHLVLMPDGLCFAPHPVVTDTDRDKFCVNRIIDFYKRQRPDYADYFLAAWRFRHRSALGTPNTTLDEIASEAGISAKYLATVWAVLTEGKDDVGPVAALRALWKELPEPAAGRDAARVGCEAMREFVVKLRKQLVPEVKNLTAPPIHNGSQCFVLWKNRQFVANRTKYSGGALQIKDAGLAPDTAAGQLMVVPSDRAAAEKFEATFERFCATFPDAFVVSERARVYLNPEQEKKLGGRLLSAGFHSMTGYFRDDGPLYDLVLDENGRKELDRLWREFDFITTAPLRQYTSFVWFERTDSAYMRGAEFDFARAEDKDVTSEEKIQKLGEVYLAKAVRNSAGETAQEAIKHYFKNISAQIRWVETARSAAEPVHVRALQELAERAYRRPLTEAERDGIAAFYKTLRDRDKLTHDEAVRDALVRVLMSPHFCYRVDRVAPGRAEPGKSVRPLSDHALASRLSYFLWSSAPDAALLARAAAGDLHKPEVLKAQAKRMLKDGRARGLATEFGGNWLDFRRFEEHNSVDRTRFPTFDNDLRRAMFEEPVRFFLDVAREDRSVLDFLHAGHTFVNPVLARHYGMPEPAPPPRPAAGRRAPAVPDEWVRIDGADKYGRGGLLPMSVFLTKNAPGLRTSPVKRGYWVVRRLLGEHIPAPPADVPELPGDEAKLGERTLREVLAGHREHKSCAGCHNKFDSIGVAFEGYGPIGELRTKDLGGRPVETAATFPGGVDGTGLEGLKTYLRDRRQEEFVDNLCRKLLAYALGRGLLLSDEELVRDMRARLKANGYRFGSMFESIVTSPQFLNKRVE